MPRSAIAIRSYRSREARRSIQAVNFIATTASRVGISSSAGGASEYRWWIATRSRGHGARPIMSTSWNLIVTSSPTEAKIDSASPAVAGSLSHSTLPNSGSISDLKVGQPGTSNASGLVDHEVDVFAQTYVA